MDYNSIKNLSQERQNYINQLENMIDKRQHYRIVYNSFLELGDKIVRPIESLTLTPENWRQDENEFVNFLENLKISNQSCSEGKKLLAQLMINVFKLQENVNLMIEQLSLSIPNLYHLSSQTNLIEFKNALKNSLEEICNLYLDSRDLKIELRPLLTIEDTRTDFNYIETYRLKSLLTQIFDQPIRFCYLQGKKLPLIKICLTTFNKNMVMKIHIFMDYKPNEVTLYFCQNLVKYYAGYIQIHTPENQTVWLISLNL